MLGEALALGFLVGAERYRGRPAGERKAAGVRTFSIIALLGAVCGILEQPVITGVAFAGLAVLVAIAYQRTAAERPGMTTEAAALLVFWIAYLLSFHELPAIALGIVLTVFLASKQPLHDFVRDRINEAEFEATLRFLVVVLVIYPVLPDRPYGALAPLNPQEIWGLVILVSAIGYAGYFLMRYLGRRTGLALAALVGGLASTTAVTMDLARRAREQPSSSGSFAALAVLGSAVQGPRLLLLLWAVEGRLAGRLVATLLAMTLVSLSVGLALLRRAGSREQEPLALRNPFSVGPALRFALLFVAVLVAVRLADQLLGQRATLAATALAGAASVSAAALSIADLVADVGYPATLAGWAVVAAIAAGVVTKLVVALAQGTPRFAVSMTGWLALALAAGAGTYYLMGFL